MPILSVAIKINSKGNKLIERRIKFVSINTTPSSYYITLNVWPIYQNKLKYAPNVLHLANGAIYVLPNIDFCTPLSYKCIAKFVLYCVILSTKGQVLECIYKKMECENHYPYQTMIEHSWAFLVPLNVD